MCRDRQAAEGPAQGPRVGVAGGDEAVRLEPGELEHAPAGLYRAARLRAVEACELARPAARRPREQPGRGSVPGAQRRVLKAVRRRRERARRASAVAPDARDRGHGVFVPALQDPLFHPRGGANPTSARAISPSSSVRSCCWMSVIVRTPG